MSVERISEAKAAVVETARTALVAAADDATPAQRWEALRRSELLSVAVPEDDGGFGADLPLLCLLAAEAGRQLAHRPLVTAMALGTLPLAHASTTGSSGILAQVADGTAALVGHLGAGLRLEGNRLDGVLRRVWDLEGATGLVVTASRDGSPVVVHVPLPDGSVRAEPSPATDGSTVHDISFDRTVVQELDVADVVEGTRGVEHLRDRADLLWASALVGCAAAAMDLTTAHVRQREQFGRALGTFQAVAMRLADTATLLEVATATVDHAAHLDGRAVDANVAAVVWSRRAAAFAIDAAQHLHGGVGVATDYPLHRYTRACRHLEITLGSEAAHLDRLADALG